MVSAIAPLQLLDIVALTENLPQNTLVRGQVGTIVETLAPDVYEVEFSDDEGQTYAMLALHAQQLMPLHYLPINSVIQPDKPIVNPEGTTMSQIHQFGQGDNVAGDKVMGDKVAGNKTATTNTFNGPTSGIIGSSFSDNAQASGNSFIQTNNATTAELLDLIRKLRQTATQLPKEIQEDLTIDIDDVEEEIKKTEDQRNLPKIKKRLLALATAVTVAAAPIATTADFTNTALDLGSKLGLELPLP